MALTLSPLAMEVSVLDIASKITESEAGPTLKLGVSLNLPIMELLQALQQFQHKSREPVPAPKAKEASLQPPKQPGLVVPRPPGAPTTGDASGGFEGVSAPASQPPAAEDAKSAANASSAIPPSPFANSTTNQNITWDNAIADLKPVYEQAETQSRWEPCPNYRSFILPEEAPFTQKLNIQRFEWTPLPKKATTQPDAGRADRAVEALKQAMAAPRPEEVETQLPPNAPPPSSGAPPGLPPAGPPPDAPESSPPTPPAAPPPGAAGAPSSGAAEPPPGLPAPKPTASRRGAGGAAPAAGNGEGGPANDGKECKQQ